MKKRKGKDKNNSKNKFGDKKNPGTKEQTTEEPKNPAFIL